MTLVLSTFAAAVLSALVPIVNIELILAGLATRLGPGQTVALALASGVGQTVGKVLWYEAAARSLDSRWVRRKLDHPRRRAAYDRWQASTQHRPWYAGGVMFASALAGVPPLLVMAVVAGSLHLPRWVFVPTVLAGRTVRFWLILAGVSTFFT